MREGEDALLINGCEFTTTDEKGNVLYHGSFTTSLTLDDRPTPEVAAAGRGRWKIENENKNNNTLKTKGHHFEHDDGHGQQHLSAVLASLIILAFLVHVGLEGWMTHANGQALLLLEKWRRGAVGNAVAVIRCRNSVCHSVLSSSICLSLNSPMTSHRQD